MYHGMVLWKKMEISCEVEKMCSFVFVSVYSFYPSYPLTIFFSIYELNLLKKEFVCYDGRLCLSHISTTDEWLCLQFYPATQTHVSHPWWRHQMEAFSTLLALCVGNSPVTGEFVWCGSVHAVKQSNDLWNEIKLRSCDVIAMSACIHLNIQYGVQPRECPFLRSQGRTAAGPSAWYGSCRRPL